MGQQTKQTANRTYTGKRTAQGRYVLVSLLSSLLRLTESRWLGGRSRTPMVRVPDGT